MSYPHFSTDCHEHHHLVRDFSAPERPRIVCLCGSTRFKEAFIKALADETDAGRIVLSVGRFVPQAETVLGVEIKAALDELHKRKIDLADEVYVLNVGGYIGDSTRSEVAYAIAHGKPVRWLEPIATPKPEGREG